MYVLERMGGIILNKQLIACCGLDCEKCDARIATVNNDDQLRKKTAKLWSKMNQVLITPDMINCMGCRVEGIKAAFCDSVCEIKKCVVEKGFSTCADCPDIDSCEKMKMVSTSNPDVMNNLKSL